MQARAITRLSKAWASEVARFPAGRLHWRVASTWIEQSCGTYCAEFTHVSTGKSRLVRLSPDVHESAETRHAEIVQRLTCEP